MANHSTKDPEEGCISEKSPLTNETLYLEPLLPDPYAQFRDLSLVSIGISVIGLLFFLLTRMPIIPTIPSLPHDTHTIEKCHNPPVRREWRTLDEEKKLDFLRAVQCLASKPSRLGLPTTRYDDFVYVHVKSYTETHNVAPSLPWHRYYIKIFENVLQQECKFRGQLPYWDWTLDAGAPEDSSIWFPNNGFGGNGVADSHCVHDGPFADFKPQYVKKHCLKRDFIPGMVGFNYTADKIHDLWHNTSSYHEFRNNFESGPHKSVHNGIGGEMPTDGSSNDPIFFVHHSQIDRVWWHWQQLRPEERLVDFSGPNDINEPDAIDEASLQDELRMLGLGDDLHVADVMDTKSDFLCYVY